MGEGALENNPDHSEVDGFGTEAGDPGEDDVEDKDREVEDEEFIEVGIVRESGPVEESLRLQARDSLLVEEQS